MNVVALLHGGPGDGQRMAIGAVTLSLRYAVPKTWRFTPLDDQLTPSSVHLFDIAEYAPLWWDHKPVLNDDGEVLYCHVAGGAYVDCDWGRLLEDYVFRPAGLASLADLEAQAEDQDERDALATSRAERQTAAVDWDAHRAAAYRACSAPVDPTAILDLPDA